MAVFVDLDTDLEVIMHGKMNTNCFANGGVLVRTKYPRLRRGTALLVCLFVVSLTTVLVIGAVDVSTTQFAALRNVRAYDQAYYVAAAGAHHALAELEADSSWRDGLKAIVFPVGSSSSYTVTVTDVVSDGSILVSSSGTCDGVVRTIEVNVDPAS